MVREDIVAGLKNAVERGYPLETAKQAFLNAGYSRQEVEEAATYLSRGAINIQQPMQPIRPQQQAQPAQYQQPQQPYPQPAQYPQYPQQQPQPTLMQQQIQKPAEKKGKGLVISLIVLLVILVIAAIGAFIYKTQIISFFNTLFK